MRVILSILISFASVMSSGQCIKNTPDFIEKYLYVCQTKYPFCGSINEKDSAGNTLLIKATSTGNPALIKWLLMNGAKPEVKNNKGFNSLDYITFSHIGDPCKTPDCSGAKDIWVKNDKRVCEILTIYYMYSGTKDSIITSMALITAVKHRDFDANKKTYELIGKHKLNLNYTDTAGNSLLHLALIHQNYSTAIWLIRMGIDKKMKNKSGYKAIEILGNDKKPFLEELKRELEK